MLIYHPAFDIYHGIFRILRILELSPKHHFEIEKLRIFDFYLLFPHQLSKFKFPTALLKQKKRFRAASPYQTINDPIRIFFRLEPYQLCALKTLVARQFIDSDLFLKGKVSRTETHLPEGLSQAVKMANEASPAIVEFLRDSLNTIDLYGGKGLKARSDFFEYRYDITNATTST